MRNEETPADLTSVLAATPSQLPGAPELQPDGSWLARVRGGELRCRMSREDIPLAAACGFAARNNSRRRFLFVSRLLGRHLPTPPQRLTHAADLLAQKLRPAALPGPCLFIGMAETATTLGQAVFRAWQQAGPPDEPALYIDSTRRITGGEVAFGFTEAHSHATAHLVHRPPPDRDPCNIFGQARSLVIVDDETTTAHTAARLREAYAAWRSGRGNPTPLCTVLAVLLRWHPASVEKEADNQNTLRCISLLEGRFDFTLNHDPFPTAPATTAALDELVQARSGSRAGLRQAERLPTAWATEDADILSGQTVLVVGTGEYGFPALLLAEALALRGIETFVQATTRSPVLLGGAISDLRQFPALSGESHPEFLYNVPDGHPYDHVILLCEDRLPPPGHPVLDIPRLRCKLAPR